MSRFVLCSPSHGSRGCQYCRGCTISACFCGMQHYGLTRQRLPNGKYERVSSQHSWNCNWLATSAVTFRLQRHADHHLVGAKPYQVSSIFCSNQNAILCILCPTCSESSR